MIKTAAEMFGDGAGFGAAVPYSTSNPPGTAAGNRGIQFGEQLTAAIANRTHYALCLNDEDLNTRLVSWETGGLNAAYRLGSVATPGGGRSITIDAGAVETVSSNSAANIYTRDRWNASLRANMNADTAHGGIGVDVHAKQAGIPYAFFLARAAQDLTGSSITDPDTGTLNLGAAGVDRLYIGPDSTSRFIPGVDAIEVTTTAFAGAYMVLSVAGTYVELRKLDGSTPSFTANTAVSYRVYRLPFRVSASADNTAALPGGITMSGLLGYNDTAVLRLVAEADKPYTSTGNGPRYALAVQGIDGLKLRIDSRGTLRTGVQQNVGLDFGYDMGVFHRGPGNSKGLVSYGIGGPGAGDALTHHGLIITERRGDSIAATYNSGTLGGASAEAPCPGQLFEVESPSTHAGVYKIHTTSTPSALIVKKLDGTSPGWAANSGTTHFQEGLHVGGLSCVFPSALTFRDASANVIGLPTDVYSAARIYMPRKTELLYGTTGLLIGKSNKDDAGLSAYIRCVGSGNEGEEFAIAAGGSVTAKVSVAAPRVIAVTDMRSALFRYVVPQSVVRTTSALLGLAAVPANWSNSPVRNTTTSAAVIRVPLLRLVHGATLTGVSVGFSSFVTGRTGGNRAYIQISKVNTGGSITNIGAQTFESIIGVISPITGLSEVLDLTTYEYYVTFVSGTTADDNVISATATMTVTDLHP